MLAMVTVGKLTTSGETGGSEEEEDRKDSIGR